MAARHGRTLPAGRGATFHFGLSQSYSGKASSEHQRYIEREEACVVSFGNIAEEATERERVWGEIEARGGQRKGSIRITADAPQALREAVVEWLSDWRDEGRGPPGLAGQMMRIGAAHWPGDGLRIWTHDETDHQRIAQWLREWEGAHGSQAEPGEAIEEEPEPSAQTQHTLPGMDAGEADAHAERRGREAHRRKLAREAARRRKLPRGCREFLPQRTMIQRRLILELAHELPLEAQERALRAWCERELAAHVVSYHAVIHQPEAKNDVRNWHAHVVYAPIQLERETDREGRETGRFTFEADARLPPMPSILRALGGNGPQGRRGAGVLVKQWRRALAEAQNAELARAGVDKRYDPRSYKDQGIDRTGGQHLGTKRHALETSGRAATHWSAECPEWAQVMTEIEGELAECQARAEEHAGVYEAIEEIRLEMGAHAPEDTEQIRRWGQRVRDVIRSEPSEFGDAAHTEGWQPKVRALVGDIRRIGRECTTSVAPAR